MSTATDYTIYARRRINGRRYAVSLQDNNDDERFWHLLITSDSTKFEDTLDALKSLLDVLEVTYEEEHINEP